MNRTGEKLSGCRWLAGLICCVLACTAQLFGCGNEITTEPVPDEGYFPLTIGNRWTYSVETGERIGGSGDEVWQITDKKGVWVGEQLVEGYLLSRRNTIDGLFSEETLFVSEGLVYSLGLTSAPLGTPAFRYVKENTPESMVGLLSLNLPQEASIRLTRIDAVSVNPQVHPEARAITYKDCVKSAGSIADVLSVSETACLGVGSVERVETDLITGRTKRWTLAFFELRK